MSAACAGSVDLGCRTRPTGLYVRGPVAAWGGGACQALVALSSSRGRSAWGSCGLAGRSRGGPRTTERRPVFHVAPSDLTDESSRDSSTWAAAVRSAESTEETQ